MGRCKVSVPLCTPCAHSAPYIPPIVKHAGGTTPWRQCGMRVNEQCASHPAEGGTATEASDTEGPEDEGSPLSDEEEELLAQGPETGENPLLEEIRNSSKKRQRCVSLRPYLAHEGVPAPISHRRILPDSFTWLAIPDWSQ